MRTEPDMAQRTREQGFDVASAERLAREGRLEEWVHRYCTTGGWANRGLSDGLKLQKRWWNGPLEVHVSGLVRGVGPEPGRDYRVAPEEWSKWTRSMAKTMTNSRSLPPLIAEYRDGTLKLADGNTRCGAMEFLGWKTCWVVVWYNVEEDYERHTALLMREGIIRGRESGE